MDKITLEVTEGVYTTAKDARNAGRIPMACYAKGQDNHSFSVDYQEFRRAYEKGGRSTMMYFTNEKNEEFPVIVQDIQYDPVTDNMIHVDVMAVDISQTIKTQIPLILTGEAPAVKDDGGVLMHNKESIEVECLPKDLVHEIAVDISGLIDFNTSITVGDVVVPDTIKVLDAEDINVATVSAPRAIIEEEANITGEEVAEGEGGEGEGEKKDDGVEGSGEKKEDGE